MYIQKATNTLHDMYHYFNESLFEGRLPEIALTIQSQGNRKNVLGWCTVEPVWINDSEEIKKYEINICAEAINRGVHEIANTLIHEMVHLDNIGYGIKDCSRGGTYHNDKFRASAEEVGLLVEKDDKYGWAFTSLSSELRLMVDEMKLSDDAFELARTKFVKVKASNSRKYKCPICEAVARTTKELYLICGDCQEDMKLDGGG